MKRSSGRRLDTRRGRKPIVSREQVQYREASYREILGAPGVWARLWPLLRSAPDSGSVTDAFHAALVPDAHTFVPHVAEVILKVIRDERFPRRSKARINFLSASIAGGPRMTPRRSRDVCQENRSASQEAKHRIVRYEYYIVCTCTYEGPSHNHACPQCGAVITLDW